MSPEEFVNKYRSELREQICTVRLIEDVENNGVYYRVKINKDISLNIEFQEWSKQELEFHIENIGMMYSDMFIHKSSANNFQSLDEFMYYSRLNEEKLSYDINNLIRYPFTKQDLNKDDFFANLDLYVNDIFLNGKGELLYLSRGNYLEGAFYFDAPSIKVLGCNLQGSFWAFSYRPYV